MAYLNDLDLYEFDTGEYDPDLDIEYTDGNHVAGSWGIGLASNILVRCHSLRNLEHWKMIERGHHLEQESVLT